MSNKNKMDRDNEFHKPDTEYCGLDVGSVGMSIFVVKTDGSWERLTDYYDSEESYGCSEYDTEMIYGEVSVFIDYQDLRTWFKKVEETFGESNTKPYITNDGEKVGFSVGLINRPSETQNYLKNVEISKLLWRMEQPIYELTDTICGSLELTFDSDVEYYFVKNVFLDYDEVLSVMEEHKEDLENGRRDFYDDPVLDR